MFRALLTAKLELPDSALELKPISNIRVVGPALKVHCDNYVLCQLTLDSEHSFPRSGEA